MSDYVWKLTFDEFKNTSWCHKQMDKYDVIGFKEWMDEGPKGWDENPQPFTWWKEHVHEYFGGEEEDETPTEFSVVLTDSNGYSGTVEFSKNGADWTSHVIDSDDEFEYYPRHYMSYLKPNDIITWLHRDFDSVAKLDESVNEDFSIGVGAPCGLDQGIPHGGDCKGCNPCRVAMVGHPVNHPPRSAALALTPGYWLSQIKKRKKKKHKKHFKNIRKEAYEYIRPMNEDIGSMGSDFEDFKEEVIEAMGINRNLAKKLVSKYEEDIIAEFEGEMDADKIAYDILDMAGI